MVTTETAPAADARRWALRTLGFDRKTEPLDAAALLRLVTKSDYFLTPESIDSVQIVANPLGLAARSGLLERAAALGRHQRCDEAVTSFIQQFFDLSGDERRRRWEDLVSDCADEPALAAWLNRVEPGLDIELPPLTGNSNDRQLIQTCRDVFLARPAKGARLRREFCEMWHRDVSTWEDTTDEALERHPHFFEVAAPWVDEFGELRWREAMEESRLEAIRRRWEGPFKTVPLVEDAAIPPTHWSGSHDRVFWWIERLMIWMLIGLSVGFVLAVAIGVINDLWRW